MYEYAADGIDALENIDPSKQLSHSPFYQLFQVIDVGGYSTCGNENQNLAAQLSRNLLYHLYQ